MKDEASSTSAGTLSRGLDIIEWVAEVEQGSIHDLGQAVGLSRSAAYRIVAQLRDRGYLQEAGDGQLRLGPVAIRVGLLALEGLDLFSVAPQHLRALVGTTRETAFVAVLDGDELAYVMQEVGPQVVKVSSKLGARAPLHASGLGKAYLSALPVPEREEVVARLTLTAYTPTTLTSPAALLAALQRAADLGYAIDDAERESGVRCVAAPIRDASGRPVAAISVAGPRDRIRPAEPSIVAALLLTASSISTGLGHFERHPVPRRTQETRVPL